MAKRDCISDDIYTDFQKQSMHTLMAYPQDIPEEIVQEVHLFYPKPYLFGSRYMSQYWPWGHKAKDSDWDFAFPYRGSEYEETRLAERLGWEPKDILKYMDDMSFAVYEKEVVGYKVQMCSKINMSIFVKAWEKIDPEFFWTYLHKSSPTAFTKEAQRDFFNQIYKAVGW